MPPILIPVAIAAATAAAGVGLGLVTVGSAVLTVAATAVAAGASYLTQQQAVQDVAAAPPTGLAPVAQYKTFAGGATSQAASATGQVNAARALTVSQALPPRRLVYGTCRVGGPLLLQDVANPYLVMMVAVSDGPVSAFSKLYLGEEEVPLSGTAAASGTRWAGQLNVNFGVGEADQTVASIVSTRFPGLGAQFRQAGIARATLQLNWGADASTHNYVWGAGIEPSFLGDWLLVYDPRDEAQDPEDKSTWTFSDNPALCVAHLMTNAWGAALGVGDVDWDSVAEAADDCDATVSYGGEDLRTFRLAGVVQADQPLASQMAGMLAAFGGAVVYTADGKYGLRADKLRASVFTLTDADMLGIEDYPHDTDADARFSSVKATFFDSAAEGRRSTTPALVAPNDDGEVDREAVVDLPFVPFGYCAQIIAWRRLWTSRDGVAFVARLRDHCLFLDPADVVTIESDAFPWLDGDYAVTQVDLAPVGCVVALRKISATAYEDPTTYLV